MSGFPVVTFATGNRDALRHLVAAIRDLDDPSWRGVPEWRIRRGVIARRHMTKGDTNQRIHLHRHVDDCHGLDLLRATWRTGLAVTGSITIPHAGQDDDEDVLRTLRAVLAPALDAAAEDALEQGLLRSNDARLIRHSMIAAVVATTEGLVPEARDVAFPSPWAGTLLSDGSERPAGIPSDKGRRILERDFADMPRFANILSRTPSGDRLFDASITPAHSEMPRIDPIEAMRRIATLR